MYAIFSQYMIKKCPSNNTINPEFPKLQGISRNETKNVKSHPKSIDLRYEHIKVEALYLTKVPKRMGWLDIMWIKLLCTESIFSFFNFTQNAT